MIRLTRALRDRIKEKRQTEEEQREDEDSRGAILTLDVCCT